MTSRLNKASVIRVFSAVVVAGSVVSLLGGCSSSAATVSASSLCQYLNTHKAVSALPVSGATLTNEDTNPSNFAGGVGCQYDVASGTADSGPVGALSVSAWQGSEDTSSDRFTYRDAKCSYDSVGGNSALYSVACNRGSWGWLTVNLSWTKVSAASAAASRASVISVAKLMLDDLS